MPKYVVELSWHETSYYRASRTVEADSQEDAEQMVSDNRYNYGHCVTTEMDYDSDDYETSHADDCSCEACDSAWKSTRVLPQWF